ncbi:MAG: hypothetical protein Q8O55_05615 [Dehalococcoidales bacterium]|nr:hypothetical protein [Dehalococcoidales bacterium]
MLQLNTRTKRKPEEVVKKAVEFFGPGGYGLKVTEQGDSCAAFEGGGGEVRITTCVDDKGTSVDLESREWDYQLRKFTDEID